jgi:hypothetical protein
MYEAHRITALIPESTRKCQNERQDKVKIKERKKNKKTKKHTKLTEHDKPFMGYFRYTEHDKPFMNYERNNYY